MPKISMLPHIAGALTGEEKIVVVVDGVTYRGAVSDLITAAALATDLDPTISEYFGVANRAGAGKVMFDAIGAIIHGLELRDLLPGLLALANRAGASQFFIDPLGVGLAGLELRPGLPGAIAVCNRAGAGLLYIDSQGIEIFGAQTTEADVDPEIPLPDATPYFTGPSGILCGVAGEPLNIYVRNMLAVRSDSDRAIVQLMPGPDAAANPVPPPTSDHVITVADVAKLGATASIHARAERGDALERSYLPMAVKAAAKYGPGAGPSKNIMVIADSIGNAQGCYWMNQFLTAWGYNPTWSGTLNSQGTTSTNGPRDESRSGHETGDATYRLTDRAQIVAPGGEAAYLALSMNARKEYYPWLRAAEIGDDPAIVNNGYVVDFQYLQTRFASLLTIPTPDVVIWACGTNDVRDRAAGEIYDIVHAADLLMIQRIWAAWPAAKIIRTLPGTSRGPTRDGLWRDEYVPVMRAMMDAKVALGSAVTIAPVWAMATSESDYEHLVLSADATTGTSRVRWDDDIHPRGALRRELFHALAGYVACAMDGQI